MPQNADFDAAASMREEVLDATPIWQDTSEQDVPKWKGKGREVANPDIVIYTPASSPTQSVVEAQEQQQEEEVDWTLHEPPAALHRVQGTDSEIITKIVQQSIEKIKARIVDETERRRRATEEAERLRLLNEAEAEKEPVEAVEGPPEHLDESQEVIKGKQRTPPIPKYHRVEPAVFAGVEFIVDQHGLLRPAPPKSKKRTLLRLLRRFNNNEKGETSAQGASRHKYNSSADLTAATSKSMSVVKKVVSGSSSRSSVDEEEVYCTDCFHRLIWTACENEQQWPPKCCLNKIPEATVLSSTSEHLDLQKTYQAKSKEWSLPVNRGLSIARCDMGHWICTLCRGPQHENEVCPQDRDLQRTEDLAEEEGWKRCHQCHAFVEHREACQHMTCRCGAEFCYVCGLRWRTCGCTMKQLHTVKQEAEVRRLARNEREAQEQAELAGVLRLIEEFEREEARKAHLLRLERQRQEREQREKELRERMQKEGERRRALAVKFQGLRRDLANLHERQRVEIVREHSKAEHILQYKAESTMTALVEKYTVERQVIVSQCNKRLLDFKSALDHEYATRVKQERQVEEEYQQRLQAYWAGKSGGDAQMEDALLALKRRMDEGYRVWSKWMTNELETHRFLVQEDQAIQLELMDEAEKRLARESSQQRKAFISRKQAELKWVETVVQERETMVNDMEVDEIEDGDDIDAWLAQAGLDDTVADDDLWEYQVPGAFR
ncbi:E3 ubiquitin-protein ligase rbrA 2 [Seiridium cupressi]